MSAQVPAKHRIIAHLYAVGRPLAIHEFNIPNVSQNSIGTRLPELAKDGLVESVMVPGKRYKSWRLASREIILPLSLA